MDDLIVARIKVLLEEKSLTPSAFADAIDIQRSSVSHIMSGRNKPSLDVIQKILYKFQDINPTWLLTGKGNMKQLDLFEGVPLEAKKAIFERVMAKDNEDLAVKEQEIKQEMHQPIAEQKNIIAAAIESLVTTPVIKETPKPTVANKIEEPVKEQKVSAPINTDKQIEKILVFYTDKTFSIYKPE